MKKVGEGLSTINSKARKNIVESSFSAQAR